MAIHQLIRIQFQSRKLTLIVFMELILISSVSRSLICVCFALWKCVLDVDLCSYHDNQCIELFIPTRLPLTILLQSWLVQLAFSSYQGLWQTLFFKFWWMIYQFSLLWILPLLSSPKYLDLALGPEDCLLFFPKH